MPERRLDELVTELAEARAALALLTEEIRSLGDRATDAEATLNKADRNASKARRTAQWAVTVLVAVLIVIVGRVYFDERHIHRNQESARINTCKTDALWLGIIQNSPPAQSEQEKKRVERFRAQFQAEFDQNHCAPGLLLPN